MAKKFDPTQTPYLVTWIGRGHDGFSQTSSFATLAEAVDAYNGKRPHGTVCEVLVRDWNRDQPFIDLRKTCLARRFYNFAQKKWVRFESKIAA